MRILVAALAATFSIIWLVPDDATAQSRGYRTKAAKKHYVRSAAYRRPASVGPNGLCQRDTGTPTGNLNFRNRCDVEEFWTRMQERGRGFR